MSPHRRPVDRYVRALELAAERDGVLSRRELTALGLDRFAVRDMVAAGRWRLLGRQTVCVHTGELTDRARWWHAVIEAGAEIAALDGISALIAAGARLDTTEIHLSVLHASRPLPVRGVRIHQVRRWDRRDVVPAGIPRVRQVVADLTDGAHSLGELDFARLCRERGLPEPSRQAVRRGPRGTIYLDVRWDHLRLVVEIDGAQHTQGLSVA